MCKWAPGAAFLVVNPCCVIGCKAMTIHMRVMLAHDSHADNVSLANGKSPYGAWASWLWTCQPCGCDQYFVCRYASGSGLQLSDQVVPVYSCLMGCNCLPVSEQCASVLQVKPAGISYERFTMRQIFIMAASLCMLAMKLFSIEEGPSEYHCHLQC